MEYADWVTRAGENVKNAVANCYSNMKIGGWKEDHITTQVLKGLLLIGTDIQWSDRTQRVKWEGYKLTGTPEREFGDIALLVRVYLQFDLCVDGVVYYEAKRQYFDDENCPVGFESIKAKQLNRIAKSTHASNLLLYDFDTKKQAVLVRSIPMKFAQMVADDSQGKSALASLPAGHLHTYGVPWINNIARNLCGFDLDFSAEGVSAIRSMLKSSDAPYAVINATVSMETGLEPMLDEYCGGLSNYQCEWFSKYQNSKINGTKMDHK